MPNIQATIACNLDANILAAAIPLFESEKVAAIEWSFDALFKHQVIPTWFTDLLQTYGQANRLIGHGVFFSLFSGRWLPEQEIWLAQLKTLSKTYQFDHITEHFGFMTGENFHQGAPISIPFNARTLAIGQDRLKRIADACQCPVGLENLAFSYTLEEVKNHGEFLAQLVDSVNGFIILDIHNLYCQLHNFSMDYDTLIGLFPLEKVREIHISGGSWADSTIAKDQKIRRDTHDAAVPAEVFQLLKQTLPKCPNLKYVVLEQLGTGLHTEASRLAFQQDFYTMVDLVDTYNATSPIAEVDSFSPPSIPFLSPPLADEDLYQQQRVLSDILETTETYEEANHLLCRSSLANSDWKVEAWSPMMLETAVAIARKWR